MLVSLTLRTLSPQPVTPASMAWAWRLASGAVRALRFLGVAGHTASNLGRNTDSDRPRMAQRLAMALLGVNLVA